MKRGFSAPSNQPGGRYLRNANLRDYEEKREAKYRSESSQT